MIPQASTLARRCRRPLAVLLAVYLAWFLNVLLPGHTRGSVTLDGRHAPAHCCCDGGHPTDGPTPAQPSGRDRDHCALCSFAARVTAPPVVHLDLLPLGLLERLPTPVPVAPASVERIRTYLACGPPPALV